MKNVSDQIITEAEVMIHVAFGQGSGVGAGHKVPSLNPGEGASRMESWHRARDRVDGRGAGHRDPRVVGQDTHLHLQAFPILAFRSGPVNGSRGAMVTVGGGNSAADPMRLLAVGQRPESRASGRTRKSA